MSSQDYMWLAFGAAALIVAVGLAFVFARLARALDRTQETIQKVGQLLDGLQQPVVQTLDHVGGVVGNVDSMVGRVTRLTQTLEQVATGFAKAADAAQAAVSPTVANVVGVVAGVSKGAQHFFRSRHGDGASRETDRG